jgi:hypothetical protein
VGLGSGWTASQLAKQRQLQRSIEEISSDKERRQQVCDPSSTSFLMFQR